LVSIKAVRVSVLCRDPWIKHLSTYHVKKFQWFLSCQLTGENTKCGEEVFKQIHQIIWIGPVHLDVMGIWKFVQGKPGKCLFYLTLCIIHEYQFIVSDVMWLFADRLHGKVSALLLVRIPLLMVDVRLKIRALEPVFVWLDQSTVLYLDEAWWALVACERDSGSSFFLLIICYSLWVSLYMIT